MNSNSIYLDYNATTPLEPEVLDSIQDALLNAWGNPSSSHTAGIKAKEVIGRSRGQIACMLGVSATDVVFTSGGTEANNLIINTAVHHYHTSFPREITHLHLPHMITSNIEHDSVRLVLDQLSQDHKADVTYVKVSKATGGVQVDDVIAAIKPNTCLITIMLANNETGVIQPVSNIVSHVKRMQQGSTSGKTEGGRILLHTDAAQAIGKIPVNVVALQVDYLTVVGHKFYGPRIGALFTRNPGVDVPLVPMFYGGGQERNFRPGTENTGMIAGLGKAAELVTQNIGSYETHLREVRDYLEEQLQREFGEGGVAFNGKYNGSLRLPNTCNFSLLGRNLTGSEILSKAHLIQASIGAACHSATHFRISPVLLASGVEADVARSAIRCSVGRQTTKEDIDRVIQDLRNAVADLPQ